jgi:hypothetical protein
MMSRSIHVFMHTSLGPVEAAERIAEALDAELARDEDGRVYVTRATEHDDTEQAGGQVSVNRYGAPPGLPPDEVSVLDGYDITFEIRSTVEDQSVRRAEARRFFTDIAERLGWPALLVENLDVLVAAWHPQHGRTDFPPGTSPDVPDRSRWQPYAFSTAKEE